MHGSLEDGAIAEGNDTLTESCGGAVSFMVIEMLVGSLHKLPEMRFEDENFEMRSSRRRMVSQRRRGFFCFYLKDPVAWIS